MCLSNVFKLVFRHERVPCTTQATSNIPDQLTTSLYNSTSSDCIVLSTFIISVLSSFCFLDPWFLAFVFGTSWPSPLHRQRCLTLFTSTLYTSWFYDLFKYKQKPGTNCSSWKKTSPAILRILNLKQQRWYSDNYSSLAVWHVECHVAEYARSIWLLSYWDSDLSTFVGEFSLKTGLTQYV